ncbi:unnamed protein product [Allacma fusca]|uniref:PPPDE domain-containing protein n=1 Tax=Allacma fusca TaxID=39272 RepID=A0A8J2LFM1_9HEXA|nr:unnamed protein product [Allacma fusca]
MSAEGTPVFTFEWDLSKGTLSSIVRHVGLLVFGTFYEYCTDGIVITKLLPGCLPLAPQGGIPLNEFGVELGRTTKTEEEFNDWVSSQSSNSYTAANYNAAFNNCILFAKRACVFLNIQTPVRWAAAIGVLAGFYFVSVPVAAIFGGGSTSKSAKKS